MLFHNSGDCSTRLTLWFGVIDGFRWAILGNDAEPYWLGFSVSTALVSILLFSGINYFRRMERTFADVI